MVRYVLLAAALLTAAGAVEAADFRSGAIEVRDPWSRPAVGGFNGVGYGVISNHGKAAEALVAIETPLAAKVEIHNSSMAGGVMSMQAAPRVLIPPGGSVVFGPGGYHLMLLGLKKNLRPGDAIPATLLFGNGKRLKIAFAVGSGEAPRKPQ